MIAIVTYQMNAFHNLLIAGFIVDERGDVSIHPAIHDINGSILQMVLSL